MSKTYFPVYVPEGVDVNEFEKTLRKSFGRTKGEAQITHIAPDIHATNKLMVHTSCAPSQSQRQVLRA